MLLAVAVGFLCLAFVVGYWAGASYRIRLQQRWLSVEHTGTLTASWEMERDQAKITWKRGGAKMEIVVRRTDMDRITAAWLQTR